MSEREWTALLLGVFCIVLINIILSIGQYKRWIKSKEWREKPPFLNAKRIVKYYWIWFTTLWINIVIYAVVALIARQEDIMILMALLLSLLYPMIHSIIYSFFEKSAMNKRNKP